MNSLTKIQKAIILSLLLIIIGILLFLIFTSNNKSNSKGNNNSINNGNNNSKTVMIYIAGNDLESQNYIATGDFSVIKPSNIDLTKINVVMYTGGTKKWHNFISNGENGIYELKQEGFKKVKSFDQKNMGDANTLSEFLNYTYENYPADSYDMIFYGHAKPTILNEEISETQKESDMYGLVSQIMRYIDRGFSLEKIKKKAGADFVFIEDVNRMYLTHQDVGVQGILDRIEIKNR